jgi:putative heme iron utilization protein
MDHASQQTLARLIRSQRSAALGSLRNGAPFVSMVLYVAEPDFSAFILHISRLAHHTQDILKDPRVSLMIAEPDLGAQDPQTLARVSILGQAAVIGPDDPNLENARSLYLQKYPQAALNFGLGDFALFRIRPEKGRYVAGFGQIYNLKPDDFERASGLGREL